MFFTPLILVFATKKPFFRNLKRLIEISTLWVTSIFLGLSIFLDINPLFALTNEASLAWIFPLIMWAGFRTGKRNTSLIQLLFLSQALASAYFKVGFFADDFVSYGLSNFWLFAMLLASAGMGIAIFATRERYLAAENKQHAKLFEVIHDGVIITDADNHIISVNDAFTDISGYTAEEVIGKNPRILSSGKQSPEFYAAMWKEINEQGHWTGEVWNRHKDGSIYLERIVIHIITDANDNIISHIGNFSDITSENASKEAIAHQAQHDFLTNLPNRLLFCDRFEQQLAFAKRHNEKFAVIYLDLDGFKPINDNLGHIVGDQLLIAVAERLSSLVREIDTVSRFGGDEFAILVAEVNMTNDVVTLAGKLTNALNQPFILDGQTCSVSASIGVSLYPEHGENMESLLNKADIAMYEAKRSGRNCYVVAPTS